MLHDDAVDLSEFGEVEVKRASNVEYSDGTVEYMTDPPAGFKGRWFVQDTIPKGWYVQSARTGRLLKSGFATRAAALSWEKTYYSPGGPGWAELTGQT